MTQLPYDGDAAASSWGGGVFEILFILIVFFCILFLAYISTRFVAKRSSGRMKSRYIEIVDSLGVGADTQLLIVKAGGEFFLAAKSQKQISLLTKLALTADELQDVANSAPNFADSFRAVLEGKLARVRGKRGGDAAADEEEGNVRTGAADDSGGESGANTRTSATFRENIDRIKDMK